jgi:colicin import membrane protein
MNATPMINGANGAAGTHSTNSDKTRARLLALAMHAVFILLIVFGVSWQKKPQPPVEATLWSSLPPLPQPQPPAEPAPQVEPTPEPPKPVPKVTPPPPPPKMVQVPLKPDIAIKKDEKEKPPPKVTPKPPVQDTAKLETKKREDEAAKLEREQEAQRERAAQEAKVAADKVAAEKAAADRAARAAAAREVQKYVSGIQSKVWARVALPADLQGSPEAVFEVSLFPGGELANVAMRKSSGNAAYDAAIERAIRQAQPFVVPSGDLFQGNFRPVIMSFRPR